MKRLWTGAFVLLAACAAMGQKPAVPEVSGPKYEDLLAKLQGGDTKIDFGALRLAYAKIKDAKKWETEPARPGDERPQNRC